MSISDVGAIPLRVLGPISKGDGWRHVRILLEPVNSAFMPIELKTDDEGSVAVVAELVEVIGSEPPA